MPKNLGGYPTKIERKIRASKERPKRHNYFFAVPIDPIMFKSRPVALAVRQLLNRIKMPHTVCADRLGIPRNKLSKWLATDRVQDCPIGVLHQLQQIEAEEYGETEN